jgi:hypothetical protein
MPRKGVGEPTLCSTKITGQIMFALDLRVSAMAPYPEEFIHPSVQMISLATD